MNGKWQKGVSRHYEIDGNPCRGIFGGSGLHPRIGRPVHSLPTENVGNFREIDVAKRAKSRANPVFRAFAAFSSGLRGKL